VFPPGYAGSAGALVLVGPDAPVVAPMVLTSIEVDSDSSQRYVEVGCREPSGEWIRRTVPRRTVRDARQILDLANCGFPVTSRTTVATSEYLAAFETANAANLPRTNSVSHTGWSPDGSAFVLGRETLVAEGTGPTIRFRGADEGAEGLVAGFAARGTLAGWREAIDGVAEYPLPRFVLTASFAPPLLSILGVQPFVIDHAGETSTGKTTELRLAGSVWGAPDGPAAVMLTWNGTRTWIDCAAGVFRGVPLILDSKTADDPAVVARLIYALTQGRSRGRGTVAGLAARQVYNTILLSIGECPLVAQVTDPGVRGRGVTFTGLAFGRVDAATAARVADLRRQLDQHFGHAGRALVQHLLDHPEVRDQVCRDYDAVVARLQKRAGGLIARLAESVAVVSVASRLAHAVLGWGLERPSRCGVGSDRRS
jgi:putative DNA primase/helicase